MPTSANIDAFEPHNHQRCREDAMEKVIAECKARKLRLTPARACVLEALLESHKAVTAYELLDRLRAAKLGTQPPVVYRALEFLIENGFAHRIERLSAFVACTHVDEAHSASFLVCRNCKTVAEASFPDQENAIIQQSRVHAFNVDRVVIEADGLCDLCQEGQS